MGRLSGILQLDTETNASSSPDVWAERDKVVEQGNLNLLTEEYGSGSVSQQLS